MLQSYTYNSLILCMKVVLPTGCYCSSFFVYMQRRLDGFVLLPASSELVIVAGFGFALYLPEHPGVKS